MVQDTTGSRLLMVLEERYEYYNCCTQELVLVLNHGMLLYMNIPLERYFLHVLTVQGKSLKTVLSMDRVNVVPGTIQH